MKNYIKYFYTFSLLIISCYEEEEFLPSNLSDIMVLKIENNNISADGHNKIKVIAEFSPEFNTEDDKNVKFIISGRKTREITDVIRLFKVGGTNKKIAEFTFSSVLVETLNVKAIISINQIEISKEENISFSRAFADDITTTASSLTITADSSFNEILITTKLKRNNGIVSNGTEADIKIIDTMGISRGILVNYINKTDSTQNIINKFTMGYDSYKGKLFAISETKNENNAVLKDTLIFYSK